MTVYGKGYFLKIPIKLLNELSNKQNTETDCNISFDIWNKICMLSLIYFFKKMYFKIISIGFVNQFY